MNEKILKNFKPIFVSAITIIMLFSGTPLFALSSVINYNHTCCCCENDAGLDTIESIKCSSNCCTYTNSKEFKVESYTLNPVKSINGSNAQNIAYINQLTAPVSKQRILTKYGKKNRHKILLLVSVFRI